MQNSCLACTKHWVLSSVPQRLGMVISALKMQKKKDQKFKVSVDHIVT